MLLFCRECLWSDQPAGPEFSSLVSAADEVQQYHVAFYDLKTCRANSLYVYIFGAASDFFCSMIL